MPAQTPLRRPPRSRRSSRPRARPEGVVRPPARLRRGAHRPGGRLVGPHGRGVLTAQRAAPRARPAVDRRPTWPRPTPAPGGRRSRGRGTPLAERAAVLLRLHDLVLDRQDEILDLIVWESGKARKHAFDEPAHIALTARYYARTAERHLETRRLIGVVPGLTRVEVNRVPKGVVGIISPWNYPFTMALCDGLPALLAGNAVVAKPDAQSMLSALLGAQLLEEAGLPADLWQVVAGPGPELGPSIVEGADYVCFTGSTATGRIIAQQCAERLIGCSLELGGKNPILVLRDADIEKAAEGAVRAAVLQRRPAVRVDGADVRRRPGLRPLRRPLRRPHRGDDAGRDPRVGQRHGLADLPAAARHGHRPRRGRRRQGRPGADRRQGAARPRAVLLRADHPRGRHPRHDLLRSRDLRAGHRALPLPRRGRGRRPRQRRGVRPQRLDLQPGRVPGPRDGGQHQVRDGEHQRGLRRDLRQRRLADGRHAPVRDGPPAGERGHPPLHRVAGGGDPAADPLRADARHVRPAVRQGDDRQPAADEQARSP